MKSCKDCGYLKDDHEFSTNDYTYCKECRAARTRAYYQAHREERQMYAMHHYHATESTSAQAGIPRTTCAHCGIAKGKRAFPKGQTGDVWCKRCLDHYGSQRHAS